MSSIIPPKGGSGTAPHKGTAAVDAAELARLRAIEAAAKEWRAAPLDSFSAAQSSRLLCKLLDDAFNEPDNPPAPLPTDEQISRLLRANELLTARLTQANKEVAAIHDEMSETRHSLARVSDLTYPAFLKERLAAK